VEDHTHQPSHLYGGDFDRGPGNVPLDKGLDEIFMSPLPFGFAGFFDRIGIPAPEPVRTAGNCLTNSRTSDSESRLIIMENAHKLDSHQCRRFAAACHGRFEY